MRYIAKDAKAPLVIEAKLLVATSATYDENPRVREIIRLIYGGCCAFCGSTVEEGSYYQIEHFYPKGKAAYKSRDKDLENLHYCCTRCNFRKGRVLRDKIMSPNYFLDKSGNWQDTLPEKLEREIYYFGHMVYAHNYNPGPIDRGAETITLFNLNNTDPSGKSHRGYLVERRLRHYNLIYRQVQAVYNLLEWYHPSIDLAVNLLLENIMEYFREEHPWSVMVIHNFGDDVLKLLMIYDALKVKLATS